MKLFLTSYRIPTLAPLVELIGKSPSEITLGLIPNAGDYYAERARTFKINEKKQYLDDLGFKTTLIDLVGYTSVDDLSDAINNVDAVWASGGNTFCLRHAMHASEFDQIIESAMKKGLVYCGESAGAIIAGRSLKGIESADEPAFAESIISDGLGLVPYYICPHADNTFFASSNAEVRELYGNDPYYIELNDNQCMVVDGEEMEIITAKS